MTAADGAEAFTNGAAPRVFTIAPSTPFVDALAAGVLADAGPDPAVLPAVRILVPNRRSVRALTAAFLRRSEGRAMLLPRISPIGDIDEEELALEDHGLDGTAAGLSLPPAMPGLRRQLLLTRLILAFGRNAATPDQAARLAAELARLLDQIHTEGLDFRRLGELVPERFAEHWELTLDFLAIVSEHWPRILAEEGCLDAADHRNRLIKAEARAWREAPPATPVLAAGSTGSIPATAELLVTVSRLPRGAVILPGLDQDADDETWNELEPCHPQYGMARLLDRLGIHRRDVQPWPAPGLPPLRTERSIMINRALRPSATAEQWRDGEALSAAAFQGVIRIDAPGPEEEARAIALIMRGALETEGKTAALTTPDRGLARRVAAELQRWNLGVDDSGGRPLAQTQPGAFLRLTARAVAEDLAPVPLLAMLKHPLAAGGERPARFRRLVRQLERLILRGPRPQPGIAGLAAALAEAEAEPREAGAQSDLAEQWRRLSRLVAALEGVIEPFAALFRAGSASVGDLIAAHVATAERLAASHDMDGAARLWHGEAGEAAAAFVAELSGAADAFPEIRAGAYPAFLDALLAERVVRPRYGSHPRLAIWGLLESRLQRADVMILGSLNEGTWPPKAEGGPWMSRPMMTAFGLPLPERRIGLAAHDFTQAFAAPEVVLTRARRVEGTPTVESRWLLRITNLIRGTVSLPPLNGAGQWLEWQRMLDAAEAAFPAEPPAPCPPVAARPRQLSVTQIEKWMRDPYSIYALHILKLRPLDPLGADPGAADYGSFVHRALDLFLKEIEGELPPDAFERLLAAGRRALGNTFDSPGVRAFWWPRFERIARWFLCGERARRESVRRTASEVRGRLAFDAPAGPFTLTATADRIDLLADGTLAIVDYKTGLPPTKREVASGFAPQLPLEAAIAAAGCFEDVAGARIGALEYWQLTGDEPAGKCAAAGGDPHQLMQSAMAGLQQLVAVFDREQTCYPARPRPNAAPRFSDYDHLARVREWSAVGHDGGD
jgi:ATP-dependent helicase/nuclease subunit B